jgi:multiple antibiotic resistance protein
MSIITGFLHDFLLAFVPFFVAVEPFGTVPLYLALTEGMPTEQCRSIVRQSVYTALCIAISFIFLGNLLFSLLGISIADFMVAGGILLFLVASKDILSDEKPINKTGVTFGVVPLGTPLMAGPAVLTTALLLVKQFGLTVTLAALVVNMALAGLILSSGQTIRRVLGDAGSKALGKVGYLILAAYAIMMVRRGLQEILQ